MIIIIAGLCILLRVLDACDLLIEVTKISDKENLNNNPNVKI